MAQFLLMPDGSVPVGADVKALTAADVLLAIPTAPPVGTSTQMPRDTGEPELRADGRWYQRWVLDDVPPPPPVRVIPPLDFLNRLPAERTAALLAAVDANPMGKLWLMRLVASPTVDLDAADTRQGLGFLLSAGVLTQADVDVLTA